MPGGVSQLVSQSAYCYCKTWRGWGVEGRGEVRGYWIVTDHGRPDQTREMSPQAPLAALRPTAGQLERGLFVYRLPPPFMHCEKFVAVSHEL
jgi:hypothetical protein